MPWRAKSFAHNGRQQVRTNKKADRMSPASRQTDMRGIRLRRVSRQSLEPYHRLICR